MASNAFLTITGQKQGNFKGPVTQKGREGSILVHSFDHQVISPRDPASGLPTGRRMHKPFSIQKDIDQSSPLLWNALVNNENLTSWQLKFWATVAINGAQAEIYTITLTNASIASIEETMLDNENPATATFPMRELISFTYQKIEWVWTVGGITAMDDWEAPIV